MAAKGDGKVTGKTTGLKVSEFWTRLFDRNFKAKKTDKQLKAEFAAEFPKRSGGPAVALLRSWYNRGQQNYGTADEKQRPEAKRSTAYDKAGNVTAGDWGDKSKKKDKKLSALARERALKTWRKKKKATGSAPAKKSKPAASKPAKGKASKPAKVKTAKTVKAEKAPAAPAGKKKFKLKSSK